MSLMKLRAAADERRATNGSSRRVSEERGRVGRRDEGGDHQEMRERRRHLSALFSPSPSPLFSLRSPLVSSLSLLCSVCRAVVNAVRCEASDHSRASVPRVAGPRVRTACVSSVDLISARSSDPITHAPRPSHPQHVQADQLVARPRGRTALVLQGRAANCPPTCS